jgi:hypothetical protein
MGVGWAIASTIIAGIAAVGGIGYLVDWLVGTEKHVFTGIGFLIGGFGGMYAVYLRWGRGKGDGEGG